MDSNTYSKIAIPISHGGYFVLGTQGQSSDKSFDRSANEETAIELASGWRAWPIQAEEQGVIELIENQGSYSVRLKETKNYCWALDGCDSITEVNSSLDETQRQRWTIECYNKKVERGSFCVVNHLGFASFILADKDSSNSLSLKLEFVSTKIDFDTEYRKMTEDIAAFCEQLLLSATAPTSLKFSSNPTEQRKVLLESFLFLRHFLSPLKLQNLSEHIHRNPHSALISEREWKSIDMVKSSHHLSNPNAMLRDWSKLAERRVPHQGLNIVRDKSHNTPPNQFVKFALQHFRKITQDIINLIGEQQTISKEARELQRTIDGTLAQPFFHNISRLQHLPLNNQTLQNREGYRDFLRSWILVQSACSLNWNGQRDCFNGETRDVATLYEYWLFLEIHKVLQKIKGVSYLSSNPLDDKELRFIQQDSGQINLRLKSGINSLSSFIFKSSSIDQDLRIDLNYEKTFNYNNSATSCSSYSRQFRPDYTLSIFPASFETEVKAAEKGTVAHLHFDAKYRVTNITSLFGKEGSEAEKTEDLTEEKREAKATSTYKRADLLKMHTYNDALRKTIGSYVLYPGCSNKDGQKQSYNKFHEIAPSVGALIMKPGNPQCSETLKSFIEDVLTEQQNQFTQYSYLSNAIHQTVLHEPHTLEENKSIYQVARRNAPCVLLWLRAKHQEFFKNHGFAYCHAISKNSSQKDLNLNLSTEIGSEFIPYQGGQGKAKTGCGWRAKVKTARFMSKTKLTEFITKKGLQNELTPSSVDYYLLFEFEDVADIPKLKLTQSVQNNKSGSDYMALTSPWSEILKEQDQII